MIAPLADRRRTPELMDDPSLERPRHLDALRALGRVNRVSRTDGRVWAEVERLHRDGRAPVRVLDVACGGGDVLIRVGGRAEAGGVPVELTGCDLSATALGVARAGTAGDPRFHFVRLDAERDALPGGHDLVCCSLFLHHLGEASAVALLRALATASTDTVLVQDLRRTRLGWVFAWIGLRLLTRSDVARRDGPASVAAAFTVTEARRLCARAGLNDAVVEPAWPQRFTIRWRRP